MEPFILEDLGVHRRVLAWMGPYIDRIGKQFWPRDTALGISMHLTDDDHTHGDTSVDAVVGYIADLCDAGLVVHNPNGTYSKTPAGIAALGGCIYADEVAAGRLVAMPDGTHVVPDQAAALLNGEETDASN